MLRSKRKIVDLIITKERTPNESQLYNTLIAFQLRNRSEMKMLSNKFKKLICQNYCVNEFSFYEIILIFVGIYHLSPFFRA